MNEDDTNWESMQARAALRVAIKRKLRLEIESDESLSSVEKITRRLDIARVDREMQKMNDFTLEMLYAKVCLK